MTAKLDTLHHQVAATAFGVIRARLARTARASAIATATGNASRWVDAFAIMALRAPTVTNVLPVARETLAMSSAAVTGRAQLTCKPVCVTMDTAGTSARRRVGVMAVTEVPWQQVWSPPSFSFRLLEGSSSGGTGTRTGLSPISCPRERASPDCLAAAQAVRQPPLLEQGAPRGRPREDDPVGTVPLDPEDPGRTRSCERSAARGRKSQFFLLV